MGTYKSVGLAPASEVKLGNINIDVKIPELGDLIAKLPNYNPHIDVRVPDVHVPAPVVNYSAPEVRVIPQINVTPAEVHVEAPKVSVSPRFDVHVGSRGLLIAICVALYMIVLIMGVELVEYAVAKYLVIE